jgi:hypothetical protein
MLPLPSVMSARRAASRARAAMCIRPVPRKTQPTISEPQNTKYPSDYTHDSGIAIGGGGPLSGASYRRSRSEMKRLQRDLHYGQYLEIPKGRRSIFASQERARRTKSVIALAVFQISEIPQIVELASLPCSIIFCLISHKQFVFRGFSS